ncbi:MAG TPA: toxic anion resistance protein, partial [Chloroflexia bacterium]|nr:toxic anion resistance protein [Chloroflexia bacterium]
GKTALETLLEQFDTIQQMVDKVVAELGGNERNMVENILFYDQLYQQNDQNLRQLLIVIAALEYKKESTRQELVTLQAQPDPTGQPNPDRDARARWLADVVSLLDVKIGDLKSRLMLAWSAGPEISILRAADVGLAMKLTTLIYVAIPTWKETAALYAAALRSQQAAAAANIVMDATDDLVAMRSKALGQAVDEAAATTERAMISTEALTQHTDAVIKAMDDLVASRQTGADARRQAEAAITENIAKLHAANQRLSAAAQQTAVDTH